MPGPHVKTIEGFIDRLNKAVSRSALLRVSVRSSGGRMLDIARLESVDPDAPERALMVFVGSSVTRGGDKGGSSGERRKAALIDLDPVRSTSDASTHGSLCDESGGRSEAPKGVHEPSRFEQLLSSIRRAAELAKRETGVHALWFGWPILHVSTTEDDDAQSVLAPLFLFPASIKTDSRRRSLVWINRDDEIGEPRWNSVLGGWLSQKLGINIAPPSDDELSDWSADEFASWIDHALTAFPSPASLDLDGGLVPVPQSSKLAPSTTPRILHAGALGLYRWQNAAVLADLLTIKDLDACPTPLDDFLAGKTIREPSWNAPAEHERYLVTDADFSQAQVIWKSREAEGLVMHGPPGTGKSQTIVNVIADSLARGERVLMVCQKDAATRVVYDRLRQAGLDGLCLEVHDAEDDRVEVFRTIRDQVAALPERAANAPRRRLELAAEIESLERDLDAFALGMRSLDPSIGLSYRDLLALEGRAMLRFPAARSIGELPHEIGSLGVDRGKQIAAELGRLGSLCHEAGVPRNPWTRRVKGIEHRVGFRSDATARLSHLRRAAAELDSACAPIRAKWPGSKLPQIEGNPLEWSGHLEPLLGRCCVVAGRVEPDREAIAKWLLSFEQHANGQAQQRLLATAAKASRTLEACNGCPRDPAWDNALAGASPDRLQRVFAACRRIRASEGESWFRRCLSRSLRKAKKLLRAVRADAVDVPLPDVAASGLRHAEALARETAMKQAAASCHPLLQHSFDDAADAKALIARVHSTATEAINLHRGLTKAAMLRSLVERALRGITPGDEDAMFIEAHRSRAGALSDCLEAIEELRWAFGTETLDQLVTEARAGGSPTVWAERALVDLDRVDSLLAWEAEMNRVDAAIRPVIDLFASWGFDRWSDAQTSEKLGERWEVVFLVSMAERWKSNLLGVHPILLRISPSQHEELAGRLAKLLEEKRNLEARAIIVTWIARQVASKSRCRWDAVFRLRASKNGPSLRLREAVNASADQGLLDMRPCWLTNPAAVSQIFPRIEGLFDLVIFDEASQCPIEQAIPTIFRGKRVLIAGDQKQLPPTSFFSSTSADDGDDDESDAIAEDEPVSQSPSRVEERIVGEAIARSIDLLEAAVCALPQTYLQVHYRSEDPALIQFSNHAFYGGRLEAPPTAKPRAGGAPIAFKNAAGVYLQRTNREEARMVVDEVASMITSSAPPTIGVVTFNKPQRDMVEDLIEERKEADPVFRQAYERETSRMDEDLDVGLFVKNLENVQGDERDVMIFSTTFGRDDAKRFYRRFGPVGQFGGERRLNVAVTRAKKRVIVLTSMPIKEVATVLTDLGGSGDLAPSGYLQLYLDYARSISEHDESQVDRILGRLGRRRGERTFEGPESPFEEDVLAALARMGVEAEPQVGDGGFRIDIAIPHRDRSRGYALAIECDGAAYHSDRSARIRDVWRQDILEDRGWCFHRIWSRTWWENHSRELERLDDAVRQALGG